METRQLIQLIIDRRKEIGITQEMLAKASGTDQARVSGYERGDNEPGTAILLRMLTAVRLNLVLEPMPEVSELD